VDLGGIMTKEDLQKFCSVEAAHLDRYIGVPFSRGQYTYATDGHLLIRVSRLADVPERKESPDAEKIWPKKNYDYFAIPDLPEPTFRPCSICKGTGEFMYVDEDDDGNKSSEIGTCYECDGDKTFPAIIPVKIGCSHFSNHFLAAIKDLPGIQIAPTGELDPALLKFDGGEGLLMPMKV
jgi:hypothetical protein